MKRLYGRLIGAMAFLLLALAPHAGRAEPLHIYAAGSLTGAFTDMIRAFPSHEGQAHEGQMAPPVFGPSGVLRERIQHGDAVDVFASADMDQPRTLSRERGGLPVIMFSRNRLCALGRTTLGLTPDNLLDRLLDPAVRLAASTPGADPGGDYAWAVFARADKVRPGAEAILQAKAQKLVGGPNTPPLVPGHGAVEGVFLANRADVMLAIAVAASQSCMRSPASRTCRCPHR